MSNIKDTALRAKIAIVDLANAIEKTFGVKAEIQEAVDLDTQLAIFYHGKKIWFGGIKSFVVDGETFNIDFKNRAEARFAAVIGYRGAEFQESKGKFDVARVIEYIKAQVKARKDQKAHFDRQAEIEGANRLIADEARPLFPQDCFTNIKPINNQLDRVVLSVVVNAAQLRAIAAILKPT